MLFLLINNVIQYKVTTHIKHFVHEILYIFLINMDVVNTIVKIVVLYGNVMLRKTPTKVKK